MNSVEHLGWSFSTKIFNGFKLITNFPKKGSKYASVTGAVHNSYSSQKKKPCDVIHFLSKLKKLQLNKK